MQEDVNVRATGGNSAVQPGTGAASRIEAWLAHERTKVHERAALAGAAADRLAVRLEMLKVRVLPASMLAGRVQPGDDEPEGWRFLRRPALLGFLALCAIALGASLPSSPFKLEMAGTWFFGEPPQGGSSESFMLFGLVAVYGGLVLLIRVWYGLMKALARRPGVPVRYLGWILALWVVPMLVVAPIFSRDVYSYAAQGEMMSHHINPYVYDPSVLGVGANSYTILSDKLWWYSKPPYGPGFLGLAGVIQNVVGHSEDAALALWRLAAVAGVVLFAAFIPRLARSFGRPVAPAFVFAVMNPIVVIHLIGGAHNDALMLGFLVAGLALARERHPVIGSVLVGMATMVKVPAAIGIVYIGWDWARNRLDDPDGAPAPPWRERLTGMAMAGAVSLATMAAITQAVGIGWGWVTGLGNPDALRSYLDPMTAVGLGLGKFAHAIGHGGASDLLLTVARGTGAFVAIVIGIRLLWRSTGGASSVRALGLTMLAVVLLGPVMQPWYLAWSVVLLGPVATGRLRGALVWLTVVVTFLGLGDAQYLVTELVHANPVIVAITSVAMLALLLTPIVPKVLRGIAELRNRHPEARREEIAV